MNFDDLTPEQQSKARSCKTPEELLAIAKEEGYELSDEELQSVSGGGWFHGPHNENCPSLSCGGYYCHSLLCIEVSCATLRCGSYEYDSTY